VYYHHHAAGVSDEILFYEIFIKSPQQWLLCVCVCVWALVVGDLINISVVYGCRGGNGLCLPILFWHLVSYKSTNLKTAPSPQPPPLTTWFYLLPRPRHELLETGQIAVHCGHLLRVSTRDFSAVYGHKLDHHTSENIR